MTEEDALVKRPPQAPLNVSATFLPLESPLAPTFVESAVCDYVIDAMLPSISDMVMNELSNSTG